MYYFYIDGLQVPIAPPSMEIVVDSKNETISLIDGNDINILQNPALVEVSFTLRLPQQSYPFADTDTDAETFLNKLKDLKSNMKSFQFIVSRMKPDGSLLFDTNLTMALESYTIKEDAEEGFDVLVDIEMKQFKEYGTKRLNVKSSSGGKTTTTKATPTRPTNKPAAKTHTVASGDTLWSIAKKYYGDGSKHTKLYDANKTIIEADAKKHGKGSSSNGHWIWAGLKLVIP